MNSTGPYSIVSPSSNQNFAQSISLPHLSVRRHGNGLHRRETRAGPLSFRDRAAGPSRALPAPRAKAGLEAGRVGGRWCGAAASTRTSPAAWRVIVEFPIVFPASVFWED